MIFKMRHEKERTLLGIINDKERSVLALESSLTFI
jgi:hypothetical protein